MRGIHCADPGIDHGPAVLVVVGFEVAHEVIFTFAVVHNQQHGTRRDFGIMFEEANQLLRVDRLKIGGCQRFHQFIECGDRHLIVKVDIAFRNGVEHDRHHHSAG
jgi:hypothetical protein